MRTAGKTDLAKSQGYNVRSRHATGRTDFSVFRLDAGIANPMYGEGGTVDKGVGFFFTDNAAMLRRLKPSGGRIMDVFLWLHNPHVIDRSHPRYDLDNEFDSFYIYADEIEEAGGAKAYRSKLMSAGHDGIVLRDCVTNYYLEGTYQIEVVFEPWQVKLATAERFDRRSDDIREGTEEPIAYHGGRPISSMGVGETVWLSSSRDVAGVNAVGAQRWWHGQKHLERAMSRITDASVKAELMKHASSTRIESVILRPKNPFTVDARGAPYHNIRTPRKLRDCTNLESVDTDIIADWARENGHDCAIIRNVLEGKGASVIADTYAVFDKTIINKGINTENSTATSGKFDRLCESCLAETGKLPIELTYRRKSR